MKIQKLITYINMKTITLLILSLLAGCQSTRVYEATDTSFESWSGWENEMNK